jgi:hypothetical protein
VMSTGERYQSEKPGNFRMIFSYDDATLGEGITRYETIAMQLYRLPGDH